MRWSDELEQVPFGISNVGQAHSGLHWDSTASSKAFAGENYDRAVVEPIVGHLLERFDDDVTHYAVAAEDA